MSKKTDVSKSVSYYKMPHSKNTDFLNVTLCTLTANKTRSLHFHQVIEIGKCIHGSGICYLNDKEIPFSEGDIQIVSPYEPHYDIYDVPGTSWYFITIDIIGLSLNTFLFRSSFYRI